MATRKVPVVTIVTAAPDRPWLWGSIVAGCCLVLAYASLRETADGPVATDSVFSVATGATATTPAPMSSPTTLAPVNSWEGTDVAGDVHLDGAGNIIPDSSLRELFDYIRSSVGQIDTAQMRMYLLDIGRQRKLIDAQLTQLGGLFTRYLDYIQAVSSIKTESADIGSLRKTYEARYWMRREILGFVMAEGFFSSSEAEDRYVLDRMEIMADKGLTAEQRAQRLAALSATEPAERRAALQPSQDLLELRSRTEQMRQAGASVEQIQSMRVGLVGAEAAERLKALDQEQADWARRMQALEAARQNILADPNIAPDDKQRRIDDVITRDFSGPEALRASALLGVAGNS